MTPNFLWRSFTDFARDRIAIPIRGNSLVFSPRESYKLHDENPFLETFPPKEPTLCAGGWHRTFNWYSDWFGRKMRYIVIQVGWLVLLAGCSEPPSGEFLLHEDASIITSENGDVILASDDVRVFRLVVDSDGNNRTIWLELEPEAYYRFLERPVGEILDLRLGEDTLTSFPNRERVGSGSPSVSIPDEQDAEGVWVSQRIKRWRPFSESAGS